MSEEEKKAVKKAMDLLLQQDRTEKELSDRLYRGGFSEKAIAHAMAYVSSFGYIDDLRYAANYLFYHKGQRSRKELQYKLLNKGVSKEIIARAMEEYESEDEYEALRNQLRKRLKGRMPEELTYEEKNKTIAYLARKGYGISAIKAVMSEKQE